MTRTFALGFALFVLLVASLLPGHAQTASPTHVYGSAADLQDVQRVVVLQPDTRWVNVSQGESVRFVIGATQFAWRFDGRDGRSFDLQIVAPPGALARSVMVYVTRSPGRRA